MNTNTLPTASDASNALFEEPAASDIHGAFGTITAGDGSSRRGLTARAKTLAAVIGPGLIVMVGDNDAGAFGTYTQAGQNYGTRLLWTLALLVPVIYVNQEMVLRLGAVTGVGYAKLILERFGRFWGTLSVANLFVLNALTIVTEFIGISLGLGYLGLPKVPGVLIAATAIVAAASTGSLRRFERTCLALVAGSLVLIPIAVMAHPPMTQVAHDFVVPGLPGDHGQLSTVVLLVIAIVGTTVAPWQLFFQQSYIVDKRITPRFMRYEKVDLWIGIVLVVVGAGAMMAFTAAAFAGAGQAGGFTDAAGVAAGLGQHVNRAAGILFAIALVDASIIGAAAVGLSTSYALGDLLGLKHSLHRGPREAKVFYAVFTGLLLAAATIVIVPGSPLGLITEGVQALAGVLLPSASLFLLLLCNDRQVLGPWVNRRMANVGTGIVIAVLVMLSVILTAAVVDPEITAGQIGAILVSGTVACLVLGGWFAAGRLRGRRAAAVPGDTAADIPTDAAVDRPVDPSVARLDWRMPALHLLTPPVLSRTRRVGLGILAAYMIVASGLVAVRVAQLALGH